MRRRRDSFGRQTFVPHVLRIGSCDWCGREDRVYSVRVEQDSGREGSVRGVFCSWDCAEAYHEVEFAR